ALKEAIAAEFSDEEQLQWERAIPAELKGLEKRAMRKMVVERGERVDGRSGGHAGTAPTVSFGWITHGWLVPFGDDCA
ncbi:MAG: hypothetical protein ACFNJR_02685, partial [Segatella oulorum]